MSSDLKINLSPYLKKYFAGEDIRLSSYDFDLITKHLSPFTRQVLQTVMEVPRGKTVTYADLARAMGRPEAVRAVASALGRNPLPIFIPCHRVIAKNGLGGYAYGLSMKRFLLDFESEGQGILKI